MFLLIVLILAALIYPIYLIYNYWDWTSAFLIFIMCLVLIFFIVVLVSTITLNTENANNTLEITNVETIEIFPLPGNSSYYLRLDINQNSIQYLYTIKNQDGFYITQTVNDGLVFIDDIEKPCLIIKTKKVNKTMRIWLAPFFNSIESYEFHIPKDTISIGVTKEG